MAADDADRSGWPQRAWNTAQVAALATVERRVPFWPVERIERLQRWRLRRIVRHAYATVPYYRETMDALGLLPADFRCAADLERLPTIDGAAVRRGPERFASSRYDDGSRHELFSSGSPTNTPKLIYWDRRSFLLKLAYAERDRVVLAGMLGQFWGQRQLHLASPSSVTVDARNRWDRQTMQGRGRAQRYLVSPSLPYAAVAEEIDAYRPQVIFSSGAYLDHFARFLADGQLRIALPRVWVYGGDSVSPGGRSLMESLGPLVYSTYQAVETGRLGFQCERRDGFHLNVDLCPVRVVDDDGREVAPGEVGELVVSVLHNRATVLLNYRIGDVGALAARSCPCGRSLPLLDRLEGRASERIVLADGRVLTSLASLTLHKPEIRCALKAQIVHPAPGHVRWRIVPLGGVDPEGLRRALLDRGREVFGEGTRVEVEFVDDIPSTPPGKFYHVVSGATAPNPPPGSPVPWGGA